MRVFVKSTNGLSFLMNIQQGDLVRDIKERISRINTVKVENQRLVFKGRVLDDNERMQSIGEDNVTLYFTERRGNAKHNKAKVASQLPSTALKVSYDGIAESLRQIKLKNPKASLILNDAETIQENLELLRDPYVRNLKLQQYDCLLDSLEMRIGGFRELVDHQNLIDAYLESLPMSEPNPLGVLLNPPTIIPKNRRKPSSDPLPNPYIPSGGSCAPLITAALFSGVNMAYNGNIKMSSILADWVASEAAEAKGRETYDCDEKKSEQEYPQRFMANFPCKRQQQAKPDTDSSDTDSSQDVD